ncbi:MAG: hypothetical protein ACE5I4_01800 [Thermoplasmata archaeon]
MPDPNVWVLSEMGILALDGTPLGGVPFQGMSADVGDARGGKVAVIVDEHELWTHLEGRWEQRLRTEWALQCVRWALDGRLLVGTEKARVAWGEDAELRFLKSFDEVPERPLWNTPFGAPPAVRSLAVGADGTLYADIHVGWVVRSRDGGQTWESLRKGLNKDVHMVAAHPTDPDVVFAATATGFHISHDRGDSWDRRPHGMPHHYQRACAIFPDEDVYLVSTAIHDGGEDARLYRSEDEGKNWIQVEGLPPALNRNIDTHQIALLPRGSAFVVVNDRGLFASADAGKTWAQAEPEFPRIWSLLSLVNGEELRSDFTPK